MLLFMTLSRLHKLIQSLLISHLDSTASNNYEGLRHGCWHITSHIRLINTFGLLFFLWCLERVGIWVEDLTMLALGRQLFAHFIDLVARADLPLWRVDFAITIYILNMLAVAVWRVLLIICGLAHVTE